MVARMPSKNKRLAKLYAIGAASREGSAWPMETCYRENEAASRWRDVLLRLSDSILHASRLRPDLAPILFDALDHAIEMLLTRGCEEQLLRLEQWLGEAEATLYDMPTASNRATLLRIAA